MTNELNTDTPRPYHVESFKLFIKLTVVFVPFYYRLYVSEDLIGLNLHQNIGYGFQRFCSPTKTKSTIMYKSQNYIYSYPDENGCQPFGTRL